MPPAPAENLLTPRENRGEVIERAVQIRGGGGFIEEPAVVDEAGDITIVGAVAVGFGFVVLLREAYRRLRGREGMGFGDAKLLAAAHS